MIVSQNFYLFDFVAQVKEASVKAVENIRDAFDDALMESTLTPSERRELRESMDRAFIDRVYELLLEAATPGIQVMNDDLRYPVRSAARLNNTPTLFDLVERDLCVPMMQPVMPLSDKAQKAFEVWCMLEEDDDVPTASLWTNPNTAAKLEELNDIDATWVFTSAFMRDETPTDAQTVLDWVANGIEPFALLRYRLTDGFKAVINSTYLDLADERYHKRIVPRSGVSVAIGVTANSVIEQSEDTTRIDNARVLVLTTDSDSKAIEMPFIDPSTLVDSVEISSTGKITLL